MTRLVQCFLALCAVVALGVIAGEVMSWGRE